MAQYKCEMIGPPRSASGALSAETWSRQPITAVLSALQPVTVLQIPHRPITALQNPHLQSIAPRTRWQPIRARQLPCRPIRSQQHHDAARHCAGAHGRQLITHLLCYFAKSKSPRKVSGAAAGRTGGPEHRVNTSFLPLAGGGAGKRAEGSPGARTMCRCVGALLAARRLQTKLS